MGTKLDRFLKNFHGKEDLLLEGNWGIEREALRITKSGDLALTPHPANLGNKTTNPFITVDFSESQLELITPPSSSIEKAFFSLKELHSIVNSSIGEEMLWPFSMPGRLPPEEVIPVARFDGTSKGNMKEIYRRGLVLRYGKAMQMISGIHYNFSFSPRFFQAASFFPEYGEGGKSLENRFYLSLARNFLRYRWLLILLFGASPVADYSFLKHYIPRIKAMEAECGCFIELAEAIRHAVSLRMSRFGYSNAVQTSLSVPYDTLENYILGVERAMATSVPEYENIGLFREGEQVQLNSNAIQIENELYAPFRLKQVLREGETLVGALRERGVEYIEIRSIDINPFVQEGISLRQLYFLHVFLIYCLMEESDVISGQEEEYIGTNNHLVSLMGRRKDLLLYTSSGQRVPMESWGLELFDNLRRVAEFLDRGAGGERYLDSVEYFQHQLINPRELLSARILEEMLLHQKEFADYGTLKALEYAQGGQQHVFENTWV